MRICNECKKKMNKGYCIENGMEYYCTDECLHKHYTEEEFLNMYNDGDGDSYYTEWESEEKDDVKYFIDLYLKRDNYTLTAFQLECIDYMDDISSSIEYGENDIEVSMEIWQDDNFYLKIDNKGNILKEW